MKIEEERIIKRGRKKRKKKKKKVEKEKRERKRKKKKKKKKSNPEDILKFAKENNTGPKILYRGEG